MILKSMESMSELVRKARAQSGLALDEVGEKLAKRGLWSDRAGFCTWWVLKVETGKLDHDATREGFILPPRLDQLLVVLDVCGYDLGVELLPNGGGPVRSQAALDEGAAHE
jgi:hypothetical protein